MVIYIVGLEDTPLISPLTLYRPTTCSLILVPVPCSQVLMVESLLEGMLSLMHLQPVYYYERAVAKNVLPKSLIPQVSFISFETKTTY